MEINFRRHGDVNFHPISQEEFEKAQGEIIEHKGSYIVARGEATGSTHDITVKNPKDMIIKETENGERYIALLKEAIITHTHDHETITTPVKKVFYIQIPEREMDHFSGVVRKVID